MSAKEIAEILHEHAKWMKCEGGKRADLRGADLCGANLSRANLRGADLCDAKNVPYIPMACPDDGEFIGWKKCKDDKIVKLKIPADAKRSSASGRKCRCDKAEVLSIESIDGKESFETAYSKHAEGFEYRVGETVKVDDFNEDRFSECAEGIHFFINRREAVEYMT